LAAAGRDRRTLAPRTGRPADHPECRTTSWSISGSGSRGPERDLDGPGHILPAEKLLLAPTRSALASFNLLVPADDEEIVLSNLLTGFAGGLLIALVAWITWRLARRGRKRGGGRTPALNIESFVTSMRAVGELSVFRIMTKEVIAASEHWFGEFGRKYLQWLLSEQRVTLIIEFDVDFRYDLTDPAFRVERTGDATFRFVLPPCRHEVRIRDLKYHSEDKPELLPWLVPDLLGRFFTGGFSVEAKNKLITETRQEASRFAGALVEKATAEAQASAKRTLTMLAQGLGAWHVDFEFTSPAEFRPTIDSSRIETPMAVRGEVRSRDEGERDR
jgi:hypothetical protein